MKGDKGTMALMTMVVLSLPIQRQAKIVLNLWSMCLKTLNWLHPLFTIQ